MIFQSCQQQKLNSRLSVFMCCSRSLQRSTTDDSRRSFVSQLKTDILTDRSRYRLLWVTIEHYKYIQEETAQNAWAPPLTLHLYFFHTPNYPSNLIPLPMFHPHLIHTHTHTHSRVPGTPPLFTPTPPTHTHNPTYPPCWIQGCKNQQILKT